MTTAVLISPSEDDLFPRYGALMMVAEDRCVPPFMEWEIFETTRIISIEWCGQSGVWATHSYSYKAAICQQVAIDILRSRIEKLQIITVQLR
jgi:hypothetical protein